MSQIDPDGESLVIADPEQDQASALCMRLVRLQGVPGYLPGMRQPAVLADIQLLSAVPAPVLQQLEQQMEELCTELPVLQQFPEFKHWPALASVTQATLALLQRAGWPLFSPLKVLSNNVPGQNLVRLAIPSLPASEQGVALALQGVLDLLHALAAGAAVDAVADLKVRLQKLHTLAPQGMNTLRFLQAAHAQGIPWQRLVNNVYQFGWGARARWLDSSMTDQTISMAVKISRDKRAAALLLRQAGLPVPAHRTVTSVEDALKVAGQLGYPVVVKPADLDGGQGVTAWLNTPAEVATAYAAAAALSAQVLVEKHCFGNDYRLQVFQGEVYWAVQRVPAGVTGDGVHSVRDLLKAANADPRRGGAGSNGLKWITVDDEVHMWLGRQSLSLDAIPDKNCFVRLRGAANVASGGTTEPVLALAHPDNLALAARAATVLRLDVAGVDLLVPDISRSWRESGAAICEVNSQPQMAAHLPALLLPRLVAGEGRIPVLVVLGGERDSSAFCALLQGLAGVETGFGLAAADGAWVKDMQVAKGPLNSFQAVRCLIADPAVTMLVLHATDASMLRTGCPFDRIDHLVLAGPLRKAGAADWPTSRLLAAWLAEVAGKVWLLDAAPEWQHARLRQAGIPPQCADVRELLAQVIQTREA